MNTLIYLNLTIPNKGIGINGCVPRVVPFMETLVAETTGGVSPLAWTTAPDITIIDETLNDYDINWAAADHPYAVFPTTFDELIAATNAKRMVVGD